MGKRAGRVLVCAMALGLVFALALSASGLMVPASQRAALGASITATLISGEASIVRPGGSTEALLDGAVLRAGETVRTGPDSRIVLTYFEGSTVAIEPSSELTIDEAAFGDAGSTIIRMTQVVGHTWHVVTKLIRSGSRYEVRTPTSTTTVRGTEFEVDVQESGETRVSTTAGAVSTTDTDGMVEVIVTAGLETTVKAGETPAPPVKMPEPLRKVSVQLDSTNSMVVDAHGRANGMKDGRIVLQTPGAKIERNAAGIVVILPDPPQGRIAVVGREAAEVRVVTTVQTTGREDVRSESTVRGNTLSQIAALPAAPAAPARAASPTQPSIASAVTTVTETRVAPVAAVPAVSAVADKSVPSGAQSSAARTESGPTTTTTALSSSSKNVTSVTGAASQTANDTSVVRTSDIGSAGSVPASTSSGGAAVNVLSAKVDVPGAPAGATSAASKDGGAVVGKATTESPAKSGGEPAKIATETPGKSGGESAKATTESSAKSGGESAKATTEAPSKSGESAKAVVEAPGKSGGETARESAKGAVEARPSESQTRVVVERIVQAIEHAVAELRERVTERERVFQERARPERHEQAGRERERSREREH